MVRFCFSFLSNNLVYDFYVSILFSEQEKYETVLW